MSAGKTRRHATHLIPKSVNGLWGWTKNPIIRELTIFATRYLRYSSDPSCTNSISSLEITRSLDSFRTLQVHFPLVKNRRQRDGVIHPCGKKEPGKYHLCPCETTAQLTEGNFKLQYPCQYPISAQRCLFAIEALPTSHGEKMPKRGRAGR